jgi:CRP-like cAMP-binding protein/Fe-S-cluster-containing hydrogenase component 2
MPEILPAELGGERLTPDELAAVPDFTGIRKTIWEKFPGAITRKKYAPGDILMREGENGTTAFYILSGTAEIFIQNAPSRGETPRRPSRGWLGSFLNFTDYLKGVPASRKQKETKRDTQRTHIPIDGPVDLPLENAIQKVGPGEIIGEMAALNALAQEGRPRPKVYPRSATVRAETAVVAFEMLPHVLNNVLYRDPTFKKKLDDNYRWRALNSHLHAVPLFRGNEKLVEFIRDRGELIGVEPGHVICREGERADAFYLIRMGFVKVSQKYPGGELVLNYLSRGSYFGEIGLLAPVFRVRARDPKSSHTAETTVWSLPVTVGRAPAGPNALEVPWDHDISREHARLWVVGNQVRVERVPPGKTPITFHTKDPDSDLVSPGEQFVIGKTTFDVIQNMEEKGLRTATCTAVDFVQLVRIGADDFARMLEDRDVAANIAEVMRSRLDTDIKRPGLVHETSISDFLEQDLMQGQNLLLLDLNKCTRCDECVKACVATHEDGETRLIRDGLRFENFLVPTSCRACLDPLCMTRCPVGSIRRTGTLDIVIEDWCIGCNNCAELCPYGNINVVQIETIDGRRKTQARPLATVCDLSAEYPEPNCVRACPHDAAIRVEPRSFFARDLAGMKPPSKSGDAWKPAEAPGAQAE